MDRIAFVFQGKKLNKKAQDPTKCRCNILGYQGGLSELHSTAQALKRVRGKPRFVDMTKNRTPSFQSSSRALFGYQQKSSRLFQYCGTQTYQAYKPKRLFASYPVTIQPCLVQHLPPTMRIIATDIIVGTRWTKSSSSPYKKKVAKNMWYNSGALNRYKIS